MNQKQKTIDKDKLNITNFYQQILQNKQSLNSLKALTKAQKQVMNLYHNNENHHPQFKKFFLKMSNLIIKNKN